MRRRPRIIVAFVSLHLRWETDSASHCGGEPGHPIDGLAIVDELSAELAMV